MCTSTDRHPEPLFHSKTARAQDTVRHTNIFPSFARFILFIHVLLVMFSKLSLLTTCSYFFNVFSPRLVFQHLFLAFFRSRHICSLLVPFVFLSFVFPYFSGPLLCLLTVFAPSFFSILIPCFVLCLLSLLNFFCLNKGKKHVQTFEKCF